jgi:hypothetical protein
MDPKVELLLWMLAALVAGGALAGVTMVVALIATERRLLALFVTVLVVAAAVVALVSKGWVPYDPHQGIPAITRAVADLMLPACFVMAACLAVTLVLRKKP